MSREEEIEEILRKAQELEFLFKRFNAKLRAFGNGISFEHDGQYISISEEAWRFFKPLLEGKS